MIYIASPYTPTGDEPPSVMDKRHEITEDFIVKNHTLPLFSPIVYTHGMAKKHDLPKDFEYWQKVNHNFIDASSEVWVLKIDGWDRSKGVKDEIEYAQKTGKDLFYVGNRMIQSVLT